MSNNPYESPDHVALPKPRGRLLPVAIGLMVVSLLWVFLSLFAIAFFVGLMLDPETPEDTRRLHTTYIMYMSISIGYCLVLVSGALSNHQQNYRQFAQHQPRRLPHAVFR